MIWIDVDTAVELIVNLVPLVNDTDFKTIDETIAYNESGMDLNWNFVTTAGVVTQTNVVPTTGGDYDWAHVGNGIYKIEMTATGGASADNDTEGFGFWSGIADAVLPFTSPIYGFRAAALNNALVDGGDTLDVNVTAMAAGVVSAAAIAAAAIDNATFAADVGNTVYATNVIALAVRKALDEIRLDHLVAVADADDVVDNSIIAMMAATGSDWSTFVPATDALQAIRDNMGTPQTGDSFARIGAPVGASISADIADVPTVAEFEARTLAAVDYFDWTADTVAHVTLVDTTTTLTNMDGVTLSVAGLAAFFTTNSGETYATSVAGSVVNEIADNATAGAVTVIVP